MKKNTYEMDMCHGPLAKKMFLFTFPLICSGMLQLLFNAIDMIVVGRYAGKEALAAVGATASLINLLVNVFIGLSVGANVVIAQSYGAHNEKELQDALHTSIFVSILSGVFLSIVGFFVAEPLLLLMGTPKEVAPLASLYMQIYFLGMPAMLLYNFGSSILRAMGDTKRPLYFLFISGVSNALLNLLFVIGFNMSVAGVALATVLSQCIAALLIVNCLVHTQGLFHLSLKKLRIEKNTFIKIVRIGLPAGLQGALFSLSNVLVQSSVNSFGALAMAGNAATVSLEGFVYTGMNSFSQTALNFTGQNIGAKQYGRIKSIMKLSLLQVFLVGSALSLLFYLLRYQLIGLYTNDPTVVAYALKRMQIIFPTYYLCGIMDVLVGCIRGLGFSFIPMIVSLLGACGLRILWIFTLFLSFRSLTVLYISYPVSWTVTLLIHLACFLWLFKKHYAPSVLSTTTLSLEE